MTCPNCDRPNCLVDFTSDVEIEARHKHDIGEIGYYDWQFAWVEYSKAKMKCDAHTVDWRARAIELEQLLRLSLEIMDAHLPMTGYGYPDEELRPLIARALERINLNRK